MLFFYFYDEKSDKRIRGNSLPQETITAIGSRIKGIRKTLDITQRELTTAIEIASASYLSEIESGKTKPGFEFMYRFCNHYQVNPMYLMNGDEPKFLNEESVEQEKIPIYEFGIESPRIHELLETIEQSSVFKYAFLEFSSRYMLINSDVIAEDIRVHKEKKLKEGK